MGLILFYCGFVFVDFVLLVVLGIVIRYVNDLRKGRDCFFFVFFFSIKGIFFINVLIVFYFIGLDRVTCLFLSLLFRRGMR